MSRKQGRVQSLLPVEGEFKAVYITEYEITSEPIQDRFYKRLSRSVKDAFERLHYESQSQPRKAIPELLEWIEKYPQLPMLYNYLSVAYSMAGQYDKMEAVVLENYRRNPDYLFARLNYAEICLKKGDYQRVAEILEHKFDLKLLYPKRRRFHISEVVNFMGLVGVYFIEIGARETAKKYYDMLDQLAPDHPMTKRLRRKLSPGFLPRLLGRLR
jgi:tetratricopeptide (TPR) repeat protein